MTGEEKLNGSVDLLAQAMRKVFSEAVEGAVEPLATEVKALRTETRDVREKMATKADLDTMREDVKAQTDTINQNVQSQLAQHRKDVSDDMKATLAEKD